MIVLNMLSLLVMATMICIAVVNWGRNWANFWLAIGVFMLNAVGLIATVK